MVIIFMNLAKAIFTNLIHLFCNTFENVYLQPRKTLGAEVMAQSRKASALPELA